MKLQNSDNNIYYQYLNTTSDYLQLPFGLNIDTQMKFL